MAKENSCDKYFTVAVIIIIALSFYTISLKDKLTEERIASEYWRCSATAYYNLLTNSTDDYVHYDISYRVNNQIESYIDSNIVKIEKRQCFIPYNYLYQDYDYFLSDTSMFKQDFIEDYSRNVFYISSDVYWPFAIYDENGEEIRLEDVMYMLKK